MKITPVGADTYF